MSFIKLSVLVHSLFSAWMLAFLFEGQIFYSLADAYKFNPAGMVFGGVAAIFAGLLLCGLFIKTKKAAKRLFLCSYLFFIMRNLPRRMNRTYILYVAIAMIGLSFVGFMGLGRGAASYLAINTLMLGAFGVYDLFWWSILSEMLEPHKNPAKILGMGLSANVLGVLLGGLIGNAYLAEFSDLPARKQTGRIERAARFGNLSERESQVAFLLLQGKTYKTIAGELTISENTVKYYVKSIYSKFGIQSRAELIDIIQNKADATLTK
jgi:DNA-binding CsgD family transcriptional regulator